MELSFGGCTRRVNGWLTANTVVEYSISNILQMKGGVKMEQERGRKMKRTTEQIVSNRHILERMTLNNSHSLNLK
jgi:hypothetical protein